jgi:predicted MFS family arabinose efflux permease
MDCCVVALASVPVHDVPTLRKHLTYPLLRLPFPSRNVIVSAAYGWRAPFIALLAFSGLILLCCSLAMRETHQYKTLQRLIRLNPSAAHSIAEAPQILAHKPGFSWRSPWSPLALVFEKQIVLHMLVGLVGFSALVSSQTELPMVLAGTYNLSPGLIGVSMLPTGIAGIIFSPVGGRLFDRAAASNPGHPMLRLRYNNMISVVGMPSGLLIWGWAAHMHAHLAIVFVGLFLVGGSMCIYLPAVMGYLTCVKQHQASTAAAGQNALTFVVSGGLILAGSAIATSVGIGWYCTILAIVHAACGVAAQLQIHRLRLATKRAQQAAMLQLAQPGLAAGSITA